MDRRRVGAVLVSLLILSLNVVARGVDDVPLGSPSALAKALADNPRLRLSTAAHSPWKEFSLVMRTRGLGEANPEGIAIRIARRDGHAAIAASAGTGKAFLYACDGLVVKLDYGHAGDFVIDDASRFKVSALGDRVRGSFDCSVVYGTLAAADEIDMDFASILTSFLPKVTRAERAGDGNRLTLESAKARVTVSLNDNAPDVFPIVSMKIEANSGATIEFDQIKTTGAATEILDAPGVRSRLREAGVDPTPTTGAGQQRVTFPPRDFWRDNRAGQAASTLATALQLSSDGPSTAPSATRLLEQGEHTFKVLEAALQQLKLSHEQRPQVNDMLNRRRTIAKNASAEMAAGRIDKAFAVALRESLDVGQELRNLIGDDRFIEFSKIWAQRRQAGKDSIRDELLPRLQTATTKLDLTDAQRQRLSKLWAEIEEMRQQDERELAMTADDVVAKRKRLATSLGSRIVTGLKEILDVDQYDQLMKLLPASNPSDGTAPSPASQRSATH